jgi:predicted GNAT family N-acyltransferase
MQAYRPTFRAPAAEAEWAAYYELRWQILRAPWGQPRGSERDTREASAIHRAAFGPGGQVIGCGRAHALAEAGWYQLRYMAVAPEWRGHKVGAHLLAALESAVLAERGTHIMLQAREAAARFYERHGYRNLGLSYVLFGDIQHYRLEKHWPA